MSAPQTGSGPDGRITRGDIEGKLREIRGEVDTTASQAKPVAITVAAVAAVAVIGVVDLLGRRAGRKKQTFVEIRRV